MTLASSENILSFQQTNKSGPVWGGLNLLKGEEEDKGKPKKKSETSKIKEKSKKIIKKKPNKLKKKMKKTETR